ncbi:MAG: putative hydrolase [Actinomycetia bacterium]|nr:putative hydrolase [Actinomycetes bacterium]
MTNNRARRSALEAMFRDIAPLDELEAEHRANSIAWVRSAAEIYRTRKPDVPPKHLVAYFAVVDVTADRILLVDHINAGLWLPAGGHVEPDEDPHDTVARELVEELGAAAQLVAGLSSNPLFITQTTTVGADAGHVDVSLWYAVGASTADRFEPDHGEFRSIRWWTFAEIHAAPPASLDPHLARFVTKLQRDLAR